MTRCLGVAVVLLLLVIPPTRADRGNVRLAFPTSGEGTRPACRVSGGNVQAFAKDYAACVPGCANGPCPCCVSPLGRNQWLFCRQGTCCLRLISGSRNGIFARPFIAAFEQVEAISESPDSSCVWSPVDAGRCPETCAFVASATGTVQNCGNTIALPSYDANLTPSGNCSDVAPPENRSTDSDPSSPISGDKPSMNAGKVVGFVIGSILLMALTVAIVVVLVCAIKKRKSLSATPSVDPSLLPGKARSKGASAGIPEHEKMIASDSSSIEKPAMALASRPSVADASAAVGRPSGAATANGPAESAQCTLAPIAATVQYPENRHPRDSAARVASANLPRATRSGAREDDLDGISLVELDETVGETSDGGEAASESHFVPVEYVAPSRTDVEKPAPAAHGLKSEPGPDIQTGVVPAVGVPGSQSLSDTGNRTEPFPRTESNISIEQTDPGRS
jgi:hypothetical protein